MGLLVFVGFWFVVGVGVGVGVGLGWGVGCVGIVFVVGVWLLSRLWGYYFCGRGLVVENDSHFY